MFKKIALFLWETIKLVLVSLIIIVPIRYFIIQPFFVLGASMEPSFESGDYLIVDEISYRFDEPKRGDVIVFRYPKNPKQFYIKRIVGLPGEIVALSPQGVLIKNNNNPQGFTLEEDYLSKKEMSGGRSTTLAYDEYFVLGDNRRASSDSRTWGPLKRDLVIGKVLLRAFPFEKAELFKD